MESKPSLAGQLRAAAYEEIFKVLGMSPRNYLRKVLVPLLWLPIQRFALLAERFDHLVASSGFHEAMRQIIPSFIRGVEVSGNDDIPRQGPLLVVSNHPGTYDSLVITASLPRNDIRIIASGLIHFLRNLPATSQHLIFTTLNAHERMMVIRRMIRELREGKSLLIYPSGKLDPDPAHLPGAEQALMRWSPSVELIMRKVPQTRVVVAMVSNVLSPNAWRNPFQRFLKDTQQRLQTAEIFQVLQQMLFSRKFDLVPRVAFSGPYTISQLEEEAPGSSALMPVIIQKAQSLLPRNE